MSDMHPAWRAHGVRSAIEVAHDMERELREAREEIALMREEIESQERAHAEVIARHMALHRYDQRVHAACVAARAKLHQAMRYTGLMRGDLVREAIDLLTAGPERMPDN